MSYPVVKIFNSTNFIASGEADYVSAFCSNDSFVVTPGTQWKADGRGICLLTRISATIKTPEGDVVAAPYISKIGTSYSNFAIIQTGVNSFTVTRITALSEDPIPEDYAEPTAEQK